jgi:hypothetical protein
MARIPKYGVQHRPVFGFVNGASVASGVQGLFPTTFLQELQQMMEGLIVQQILGVIQEPARPFGTHSFGPVGIGPKQILETLTLEHLGAVR